MTSLTFSPVLSSIQLHRFTFTTKPQFHPFLLFPRFSTMTTNCPSVEVGASNPSNSGGAGREDVLVQYVVLRRDLIEEWPMGSVVTQGCHAAVAAVWMSREDEETRQYCGDGNIDSMHKVTLEVKGETQMLNLSEKLMAGGIVHKLWIEQPENIPTCLATKPYPKSSVASFFKKLKLCK
ncbi:putative peptidyl-tRNA hydrolase PTRHD1 [Drosera capensis]